MCNLYEYEMTAEVIHTIRDHFNLVGTRSMTYPARPEFGTT